MSEIDDVDEIDEYAGDHEEEQAYATSPGTHLTFFETIDEDLAAYRRFLEFHDKNFKAFSINLARIYLSVGSEVDVVAKMIAQRDGGLTKKQANMDDYRKIISNQYPYLSYFRVRIRPMQLIIQPWENWLSDMNPQWWKDYNGVKHHREKRFFKANLDNVLYSSAGLLVLLAFWYGEFVQNRRVKLKFNVLEVDQSVDRWIVSGMFRSKTLPSAPGSPLSPTS